MSKKAARELAKQKRVTWDISPVTRKTESKKVYNRKKRSHDRYDDYGMGVFLTCQTAGYYLGIPPMAVSLGMRNNLLPIGFAIHNEEKDHSFSESWSYYIVAERLIAYKHGRITEVQIQNVEKSLTEIIKQFESLKSELVFILSESAE